MRRGNLAVIVMAFALLATQAEAATTKFVVDTNHSNIAFAVPIAGGFARVRGKFTDFTVTIVFDDVDITKSSVTAVIKATSIDTGVERRDTHLRSADFFEVEKFPEITFTSNRIVKKGKQLIAYGTFTMRGVSKEIALPFKLNGTKTDPKDSKTILGFSARHSLNRQEFGVKFKNPQNPDFIGDVIEIELDLITRAAVPGQT